MGPNEVYLLLPTDTRRERAASWMPALFLLLYAVFFMSTGVNQLSMGTLSGKLVRPKARE